MPSGIYKRIEGKNYGGYKKGVIPHNKGKILFGTKICECCHKEFTKRIRCKRIWDLRKYCSLKCSEIDKKGKKSNLTKEGREKIRLDTINRIKKGILGFKKGYKPTEKHLRNLSKSHKGQKAWNKGIKMDSDFREKCRQCQLGKKKFRSEESKKLFKEKMSGKNNPRWIEDRTKLQRYGDTNKDRRSSAYNYWRKEVWIRDNFKCKINNKDCKGRLEVHHILSYTDYPELRYDINNGICLCHFHHPKRWEEEKRLSPYFMELVSVSKEQFDQYSGR